MVINYLLLTFLPGPCRGLERECSSLELLLFCCGILLFARLNGLAPSLLTLICTVSDHMTVISVCLLTCLWSFCLCLFLLFVVSVFALFEEVASLLFCLFVCFLSCVKAEQSNTNVSLSRDITQENHCSSSTGSSCSVLHLNKKPVA